MGATFVEVPAKDIEGFLSGKGFTRTVVGCEVVYVRKSSRNPDVRMKVYTSVRVGNAAVRRAGRDAIRVCVVFENDRGKSFGIGRFPHVNRVGSVEGVLGRIKDRLLEAANRANQWIDGQSRRDASRGPGGIPADLPGARPLSISRLSPPRGTPAPRLRDRPYGDPSYEERVREKNEISRREAEAESRAFMSDPDFRSDPPVGTYASTARLLAELGVMSGDEADAWKDAMKDSSFDEPGHFQHAGEP